MEELKENDRRSSINLVSRPTLFLDLESLQSKKKLDPQEILNCKRSTSFIPDEKLFTEQQDLSKNFLEGKEYQKKSSIILEPNLEFPEFDPENYLHPIQYISEEEILRTPSKKELESPNKRKKRFLELNDIYRRSALSPLRPKLNHSSHVDTTKSKIYPLISVFYLTIKFIKKLKMFALFNRPNGMTKNHFQFIDDKSFNFENYQDIMKKKALKIRRRSSVFTSSVFTSTQNVNRFQKDGFFSRIYFSIKKTLNYFKEEFIFNEEMIPLINPSSNFRIFWDLLHLLFITIFLFRIPIQISFHINLKSKELGILQFIFCVIPPSFFFLDFLFNLNIPFYRDGKIINKRKKIIEFYFKKDFLRDFISFCCIIVEIFFMEAIPEYYRYFTLLFFLKLYNVKTITNRIEEYLFLDENHYNTFALVKLCFRIFFISHAFACLWYIVGVKSSLSQNWLINANINDAQWFIKYLYSYYFVAISMSTVGFGDIAPSNHWEIAFNIFFVYFACGIFAYTLNSVAIILQDINKRKIGFNNQVKLINGYMRKKNIPMNLRHRIRKYLEYLWAEERSCESPEIQFIIDNLSDSLRSELILEANGHFLKKVKIISNEFSEEFLRKLVFLMEEVNLMPGDTIYKEGDRENNCIFLVKEGEVELYHPNLNIRGKHNKNYVLRNLKKDKIFGKFSFFTDEPRNSSAKSVDFTTLLKIEKSNFMNLLQNYPDDYELFCSMKNRAKIEGDKKLISNFCSACDKFGHDLLNCHFLTLKIPKGICIAKYNFSQPNQRQFYLRKDIRRNPSFIKKNHIVKNDAIRIREAFESEVTLKMLSDYEFGSISDESFESSSEISRSSIGNSNSDINKISELESRNQNIRTDGVPISLPRPRYSQSLSPMEINRIAQSNSFKNIHYFSSQEEPGNRRRSLFNENVSGLQIGSQIIRRSSASIVSERENSRIYNDSQRDISFNSKNSNNKKKKINNNKLEKINRNEVLKDEESIDQVKNYEFFYPHYNINNVIRFYELFSNKRRRRYMKTKDYKRSIIETMKKTQSSNKNIRFSRKKEFLYGGKKFFYSNDSIDENNSENNMKNTLKTRFIKKIKGFFHN